MMVLCQR